MALIDFIEKLRKKPPASRRRIVFIAAFSITAVIALFWLATFRLPSFNNEDIKEITTPFSFIKEDISKMKEDISNFYNLLKYAAE